MASIKYLRKGPFDSMILQYRGIEIIYFKDDKVGFINKDHGRLGIYVGYPLLELTKKIDHALDKIEFENLKQEIINELKKLKSVLQIAHSNQFCLL